MRRIPLEIWLVALVLLSHLYAAAVPANSLMAWFPSDDAFYYFETAQNIAEGYGITFDRLGRDSGFHPLWMAICVPLFALARFNLILPLRLVVLVAGLFNAGTALLIFRLSRRWLAAPAALFAAVFWAFYPVIHHDAVEMGMESIASAFFLALLFYRLACEDEYADNEPRRLLVTGLVGALAIFARLDNVFVVLAAGAWLAVRPVRARYLFVLDLVLVILGVLWSYFTRVGFGTHYATYAESSTWMVAAALAVRIPLYYIFGLYRRHEDGGLGLLVQLIKAAGAAVGGSLLLGVLMVGLFRFGAFPGFPRLVLGYESGFALGAVLLTRLLFGLLADRRPIPPEPPRFGPILTRGALFFGPVVALLLVYMAAHQAYFGTPTPVSGQVKRWWGTLPSPIYGRPVDSLPEFLGFFERASPWRLVRALAGQPAFLPEGVRLALYGLLAAALAWVRRGRVLRGLHRLALFPLFAGGFIQIISYTGTGYLHVRPWYWVAQMLLVTLALGILLDALLLWLDARFGARAAALATPTRPRGSRRRAARRADSRPIPGWLALRLAGLLTVVVFLVGAYDIVRRMPAIIPERNVDAYLSGARELAAATEPGSVIGSTGGGIIAYFVPDRTIVNLDGLMNTVEYFHLLQAGRAEEYLDRIGLDYVYASEPVVTDSDPYFQFAGRLEKIRDFYGSALFRWE